MHWSVKHKNLHLQKNTCKTILNHAKCAQGILLCGNEVSDAFNHTRMVFLWKICENAWKKNSARPRMPICRVIKISDQHSVPIQGKPFDCWAVNRTPESGPEFHDVITMQERGNDIAGKYCMTSRHRSCVIHCSSWNSAVVWILVL
jgi:hypothetical protein